MESSVTLGHMQPASTQNNGLAYSVMAGVNMAFDDHSSISSATSTLRQAISPVHNTSSHLGMTRTTSHSVSHGFTGRSRLHSDWDSSVWEDSSKSFNNSHVVGIRASTRGDSILTTCNPAIISPQGPSTVADSTSISAPNTVLCALTFDIDTLAKHITMIEMELFARIRAEEFLSFKWTGRDKAIHAPNIVASTRWFNQLNYWVRQEILDRSCVKERTEVMGHFIAVAKRLIKLNNLCSAMSIFTALQSHCIHRLKQTHSALSNKQRRQLRRLQELFSQDNNHQHLRDHTVSLRVPAIPYLGLYLTDLTYVNVAHPKQRDLESRAREEKLNNILRAISDFQRVHYNFEVDDRIRAYLMSRPYLEEVQCFLDDNLCKLSEELEPNVSQQQQQQQASGASITSEYLSKSLDSGESSVVLSSTGPSPGASPFHKGGGMMHEMLALQEPVLKPIRSFAVSSRSSLHEDSSSMPVEHESKPSHPMSQSGPNLLDQNSEPIPASASRYGVLPRRMYERNASVSGVSGRANESTVAWLNRSPLGAIPSTSPPTAAQFHPPTQGTAKCKAVSANHHHACAAKLQANACLPLDPLHKTHRKTRSVCGHNFYGHNSNNTTGHSCSCVSPGGEEVVRLHLLDGSLLDTGPCEMMSEHEEHHRLEEESSIVARAAANALAASSASTLNGSSGVFLSASQSSQQNSQGPTAASSTVALHSVSPSWGSGGGGYPPSKTKASESGESGLNTSNTAGRSSTMSSLSHTLGDGAFMSSEIPPPSISSVSSGGGGMMMLMVPLPLCSSPTSTNSHHTSSVESMRMVCQGCLQRKTHWKKGRKPLFTMSHKFWVVLMESAEDAFLVYFEPTTFRASKREEFRDKECQVQRLRDTSLVASERELDEMTSTSTSHWRPSSVASSSTTSSILSKNNSPSFYLLDPAQKRAYKMRGSGPLRLGPAGAASSGHPVGMFRGNMDWFRYIQASIVAARERHRLAETQRRSEDLINLDVEEDTPRPS